MTVATPINLILLSLFVVIVYMQFRPKSPVSLPKGPPPVVFRTFTPTTLLPFNGADDQPVYLAVRGRVFDVSAGRNFYGPVSQRSAEQTGIPGGRGQGPSRVSPALHLTLDPCLAKNEWRTSSPTSPLPHTALFRSVSSIEK